MAYEQTFEMQEDILLPVQFRDMFQSTKWTPEKRLLLAVLAEALRCYQGINTDGGHDVEAVQKEAAEWFASRDDHPFAFEHICAELEQDPEVLRGHIDAVVPKGPMVYYRQDRSVTVAA